MECCFLLDLSFVLLVLLPWSVSGTFTVIGPQQPITALVDGEAIFTCQLSPQTDAQYMDVIWFYSQDGYVVHHYKYGRDYLKYQHKNYKGRTEFLRDGISKGSVALKLRHIRPSDEGKYRCFFESPYAYEGAEFQVFVAEKFTVTGPQQPIIAPLGGEATFPCHFSPHMDAQNMNVMWFYGQSSNLVHQYKNGQETLKYQHQEYKGRTEFLRDDISNGSVALKLRHIRPSDEGKYQCSFESPYVYEKAEFQVYVAGKGSVPHIHNESIGNKEFRLTCTSTGWYPEPKVWWRKNQEESSSQDTKIRKDENGLFSIETSITASSDSTVNVSCFIWNHLLNQMLEANVSLPDALSPNDPPWMVIVPVVLISTGFIIFIVIWSLKKSKGMWKHESGIAKVESGMGESETDSLLQPSAESNVATSMSKNATGASKDASGVSKDAIGVKKEATGVSKDAKVEKKEAIGDIKDGPVEKKEANGDIKDAPVEKKAATDTTEVKKEAAVEKKEATGVMKDATVEKEEATGVMKDSTVESKEATAVSQDATELKTDSTGESEDATAVNQDATGVETEATGDSEDARAVNQDATGVETEATAVIQDATGSVFYFSGVKTEATGESEDTTGNIQKEQRRMDPSSLCHHEVVQEEDQKKMEGNLSPSPDTLKMPDLQTAKKYRVDVTLDMEKALSFHLPQMDEENSHKNSQEGCERSEPLDCMIGKERFTSGRCYWEMQIEEQMQWIVGFCKDSVFSKVGCKITPETGFWTICVKKWKDFWALSSPPTPLHLAKAPKIVRVFLDYEAGCISFYNVTNNTHIYTFQDTFREGLRPCIHFHNHYVKTKSDPIMIPQRQGFLKQTS